VEECKHGLRSRMAGKGMGREMCVFWNLALSMAGAWALYGSVLDGVQQELDQGWNR
jgi:hypothetical protein